MIDDLVAVCRNHILPDSANAVVKEPYIPFIPDHWNGVLVLAESQNLSTGFKEYVDELESVSSDARIRRLCNPGSDLGIQPWDDGSLKIAVEAGLGLKAGETAASNAVLWSQREESGSNANPDTDLQAESSALWVKMLHVLKPRLVVCSGNIADDVIAASAWTGHKIKLRLPSRVAMGRVSGMFSEDDLLRRYPEVARAIEDHPEWMEGGFTRNKVFFACHAVSSLSSVDGELRALLSDLRVG